ncbi:MAG: SDR family NAD(P)-dependent oxidoreductase [Bacteroides sp.]|nr:SDR family NAD(P)-dependent oxidoreductase [Bacteroides sp.]MCM1378627.1 SDR family NAD(P)-dependent oxidoreductase [Bacteroides sp.]MCM1446399.1 SDR family NAD(P)-dependent oxidoreductase [Prevotella sp.]
MHYALVTGGASGIGAEFCRQLRQLGWAVISVDRTPQPDDPDAIQLDLTDPEATQNLMAELDRREILPDLWINNAGIFDFRAVTDFTPERIDLYMDLHMRSLTQLCREVGRRMAQRGSGHILNMSSMSCWMPMPGIALYSATKAYIRVFSRALRLELKDSGVSVTVACPGGIDTSLFGLPMNLRKLAVRLGATTPPEKFVKHAIRRTLKGRKQYINGLINRLAIVAIGILPDPLRYQVKPLLLDKITKK